MDFPGENTHKMGTLAMEQGKVSEVIFEEGGIRRSRIAKKEGTHAMVTTQTIFATGRGEGSCADTVVSV